MERFFCSPPTGFVLRNSIFSCLPCWSYCPPKLLFCFLPLLCSYEYPSIIFHICSVLKFNNNCTHTHTHKPTYYGIKKKKVPHFFFGCGIFFLQCCLCLPYLSLQFLLALFCISVNYYQCCLRLQPWINRIWVPNLKGPVKQQLFSVLFMRINQSINKRISQWKHRCTLVGHYWSQKSKYFVTWEV